MRLFATDKQSLMWAFFIRAQLVQAKEESVEMGGYFICNGIERIIRMLIQQRRHYIMALRRGAYHKRGPNYTDAATLLRYRQHMMPVRCIGTIQLL